MSNPVIAASRFGLGARPGELQQIGRRSENWLLDQLQGPSRLPSAVAALPSSADVLVAVQDLRRQEREDKRNTDDDFVKTCGRTVRRHYVEQANARYLSAAETDQPFYERLVHFWSNRFAISADKQPIPAIAGLYEKEAIRPMSGLTKT